MTVEEVTVKPGRTPEGSLDQSVVDAHLAGLPTRNLTKKEARAVAEELHRKRFTDQAIALHLGCGNNLVKALLKGVR